MGNNDKTLQVTTFTDLVTSGKLSGDAVLLKKFADDIAKYCAEHPQESSEVIHSMLQELRSLRTENSQVKTEAYTDSLTGLSNRRFFQNVMGELDHTALMAKRVPTGRHYLALVDMDYFKSINDTYGHHAGDLALKHLSRTLKDLVRTTDIVCRIGGDEFAIILKDGTEEGIEKKIAEIANVLSNMSFELDSRQMPLQASVGFTEINPSAIRSMEKIMAEADSNLYASKKHRKPIPDLQDTQAQPRPNLSQ